MKTNAINEVTIDGEHKLVDTVHQGHPCQYLSACIPQMSESKSEMHRSHAVVLLRMQQGRRTAVDRGRCSSIIMYGVEHFIRDMINIIRIIRRGHDSACNKFLLSQKYLSQLRRSCKSQLVHVLDTARANPQMLDPFSTTSDRSQTSNQSEETVMGQIGIFALYFIPFYCPGSHTEHSQGRIVPWLFPILLAPHECNIKKTSGPDHTK